MAETEQTPLRTAVLGYGYWGPNLARVVAAGKKTALAAVCDRAEDARARAQASHPGAEVTGSWEGLLEDDSIEAVVVALPVDLHFSSALEALEAGKHVHGREADGELRR